MPKHLLFLVAFFGLLNLAFAQSGIEGIFEYEIVNHYKSEAIRQELIEKIRKVSEMIGGNGKLLRTAESAGTLLQFHIKEDSLLAFLTLFEDSLAQTIEVQLNFWAWLIDAESKQETFLSENAIEQMLEKNLQGDWQDKIRISSWFKTDYDQMIRHKKEKLTILGYECTLYELPSKSDDTVDFFWIAESLKPAKKQLLPYFFDSIFTPYGVILKKTQIHSLGESTRTIKKLELKTIESFAKELNALNLKLK